MLTDVKWILQKKKQGQKIIRLSEKCRPPRISGYLSDAGFYLPSSPHIGEVRGSIEERTRLTKTLNTYENTTRSKRTKLHEKIKFLRL